MANRHHTLHRLFEKLRRDLDGLGLVIENADLIICPLCWNQVGLQDLTLEHIVPGSVGGRIYTLTCRRCNNSHGATLDVHLANHQKTLDAIRGHGSIPVFIVVDGHKVACNWKRTPKNNANDLKLIERASNPKHIDGLKDKLEQDGEKSLELKIPFGCTDTGLRMALVRAAYLVMFHHCGYQYVSSNQLQEIRKEIMSCSSGCKVKELVALDVQVGKEINTSYLIVSAVMAGRVECYQVLIRSKLATETCHTVAFPKFPRDDEDFVSMFASLTKKQPEMRFTGTCFSPRPGY